jgi:hypothetical protein
VRDLAGGSSQKDLADAPTLVATVASAALVALRLRWPC